MQDIENEVQSHAAQTRAKLWFVNQKKFEKFCALFFDLLFFLQYAPPPQYNYTFAVEESAAKRIRPSLPAGGAPAAPWPLSGNLSYDEDDGWPTLLQFWSSLPGVRIFLKKGAKQYVLIKNWSLDVSARWISQMICLWTLHWCLSSTPEFLLNGTKRFYLR